MNAPSSSKLTCRDAADWAHDQLPCRRSSRQGVCRIDPIRGTQAREHANLAVRPEMALYPGTWCPVRPAVLGEEPRVSLGRRRDHVYCGDDGICSARPHLRCRAPRGARTRSSRARGPGILAFALNRSPLCMTSAKEQYATAAVGDRRHATRFHPSPWGAARWHLR